MTYLADEAATRAAAYLQSPADLTPLRWFRRYWGFRPSFDSATMERITEDLGTNIQLAAFEVADASSREWDDPTVLDSLNLDALYTNVLAAITEGGADKEWQERHDYLTNSYDDRDADADLVVRHKREVIDLLEAWRFGKPVPVVRIVGWAAAAERVGLQPADLRARAARGQFPDRDGEEPAAYGQTAPVYLADTLDTWWERTPARGPQRRH